MFTCVIHGEIDRNKETYCCVEIFLELWYLQNILIGKWSISYFHQILTNTNRSSLRASRTIVPKENWSPTLKLILTLTGGQFSSRAIVRIPFWHRHIWIKECIYHFEITVAVVRRCSSKYVFFKISQVSQESICVAVSF